MRYHEAETVVADDGSVHPDHAPFPAGRRVRVMVVDLAADEAAREPKAPSEGEPLSIEEVQRPLAGSVLRYDDPFGPACGLNDWNAVRGESLDPKKPDECSS